MSLDVYLTIEVDTGGEMTHEIQLFEASITHNMGAMAKAAGIYESLWRPEEIGASTAGQLIGPIGNGLERLKGDRELFEQFNPANGWGSYEVFVPWVEKYLEACRQHPKAAVRVSR